MRRLWSREMNLRPRSLAVLLPVNQERTRLLRFRRGGEPVEYSTVVFWIGGSEDDGGAQGGATEVEATPADDPGDWWVTWPAEPLGTPQRRLRLVLDGAVETVGTVSVSPVAGESRAVTEVLVGDVVAQFEVTGPRGPQGLQGDTTAAEALAQQAADDAQQAAQSAADAEEAAQNAALAALPAGGTTGQIVTKLSNDDFDTGWTSVGSGDMSSLIYDPTGIGASAFDLGNFHGALDGGVFT